MDATEANESNRTSIGDSDGSTTKGTLQTKTKPVNLTARIIQSLEDQPDQEGPKHSYPTLKDDDALSERETGVEPICFRPQVINRPNGYLDSDAYLMIAACREKFKDDEIKDKCEDAMDNTDIYDMSPVTSRLTGLSYVNKFCLMCNEPIVLDPVVWEAKFVDVGNYYQMYLVFNPNEFIEMLAMYGGNIHFIPVASHPVQQCESYAISTCNQTGLSDGFDEIMEEICHQGHSLPILHNSMRFKNIACLLCNEGGSFNGILSCGLWINLEKPYNTYTLTLNIRDTAPDGKTEKGLIHGSYLNHAVLKLPKTKRCPPGYTALLVRYANVISNV